jgi:hypothetical protein
MYMIMMMMYIFRKERKRGIGKQSVIFLSNHPTPPILKEEEKMLKESEWML